MPIEGRHLYGPHHRVPKTLLFNHAHFDKERRMKRNLITLFSFLAVASLALSACGGGAPAATEPPAKKVWTYADMTIGFLQTGSEGGWRAANTASFKESAEQLGLNLKFYDSQNDLAKQVAGFQQFIADP